MKTFGLFLFLQVIFIVLFQLGLPESIFSIPDKFIIGTLQGWFMYKLVREEMKNENL